MDVLVTGATGLVGAEVVARLVGTGHRVIGLVHRADRVVRNDGSVVDGVELMSGDVTRPLPDITVDRIVHCAAVTDFGRQDSLYEAVNVDGTRHVLDLAFMRGTPVVHVSTAYVCGERSGVVTESDLDVGQRLGNAYESSKLRAETLVRKAAVDGLPVAVVRPSIVVGEASTGVVRDFKNVYVVLKLTTQGRVRSVPGNFDALLDLVPVDHVADVVAEAAIRFPEGQTLHATAGGLSLREFSDLLAEFPSFHVPRFVAPSAFDADRLPETERAYHAKLITLYESYFRRRPSFDRTGTDAFLPGSAPVGGSALLRSLLSYAVKAGYLGPPLAGVDQVLAGLEGPC
jgi:nucleoside-diphosphate-sugar epimerase